MSRMQSPRDSYLEHVTVWLSCNGEPWGVGPTLVFTSAAALFLYNELRSSLFVTGDQVQVTVLEKSLIATMVLGMLALMTHLWVCAMRFFQYYLDTLIRDSPSVLLEFTTAGLLGNKAELMPLAPLTRFLRLQQPQIHITVCWFLALCYADYVRKHYFQRFNLPYLEQWQTELHSRAIRSVNSSVARVNSFLVAVHRRLRGFQRITTETQEPPTQAQQPPPPTPPPPPYSRTTSDDGGSGAAPTGSGVVAVDAATGTLTPRPTVTVISQSQFSDPNMRRRLGDRTSDSNVQRIRAILKPSRSVQAEPATECPSVHQSEHSKSTSSGLGSTASLPL